MVDTKNQEDDIPGERGSEWWSSEQRLSIATVLLQAGRPLTPGEIARTLQGDQSNVRRMAEQMTALGILVQHTPPKSQNRRGRTARFAYSLARDAIGPLEDHLDALGAPGVLHQGGQLLLVAVEQDQLRDFVAVIEGVAADILPQWATSFDGDKRQYLISLHGDDAEERAEKLKIALSQVEIECTRSKVGKLFTGSEFAAYARRLHHAARETARRKVDLEATWPT
jgi:hypothetical protein